MSKMVYAVYTCAGAVCGLGVLYMLPGTHGITDAKIALPIGALVGYGACWLLEKVSGTEGHGKPDRSGENVPPASH